MRGGYKVNRTEYLNQKSIEAQYRETPEFKAKNGFNIYAVILTMVLLALFA